MALALEGRYEDYSVGKYISIDQALEIGEICQRHGFKLSGFRSFEKAVTPEQIDKVREKAQQSRRNWTPYREQAVLAP
jgi:fatty aldehyde-generating acyl-ACP reductase